jgi:hypothetical protein
VPAQFVLVLLLIPIRVRLPTNFGLSFLEVVGIASVHSRTSGQQKGMASVDSRLKIPAIVPGQFIQDYSQRLHLQGGAASSRNPMNCAAVAPVELKSVADSDTAKAPSIVVPFAEIPMPGPRPLLLVAVMLLLAVRTPAEEPPHYGNSVGLEQARKLTAAEAEAALFRRPIKAFEDALPKGGAGARVLKVPAVIPIEGGIPVIPPCACQRRRETMKEASVNRVT